MSAAASNIAPAEEGLGAEDLRISAKLLALLGQNCKGQALSILK